jgi:hypothetical protein
VRSGRKCRSGFHLTAKPAFLLGANYPWYNGHRGVDFGPYLGSKTIGSVEMQTFLNEIYDAIKSVDQSHLVMPSGVGRPWQLPLVVGRVKADLFGAHYNDDGSDWYRIQPVANISNHLRRKHGLVLNKPLVMTEGPSQLQNHLNEYLQSAFDGGWAGYLAWS